ncbi:MAG TPA: peptide chain release factor N(5)-glutamine methyltransferase [bacterium]|nr:peptide chain release factor N(5)-glutamine methyltransferase [bacterium]
MPEGTGAKDTWTPLKIIQWAVPYLTQKGISNPRMDVELILAHALQLDRLKVYLQFDRPLDAGELAAIRELLKRRAQREPLQYLLGQREFFGLNFKVGPAVLIPRPETELLVEGVLKHLEKFPQENRLVLDLGTGSGCIAIAVAKNISCRVWAVDKSERALETAKLNGQNLGVEPPIEWRQGDWFTALRPEDPLQFAVIVSNPPYIPMEEKAELSPEVRDYEPSEALFAEKMGLKAYEDIAAGLKERLLEGGGAFLEIHANGFDKVSGVMAPLGLKETLERDLQGHPRLIKLEK